MKEYKCKKCGLTYDRKNKACPYCKKPRPKTGLIFILVIIVAALTGYYIYTNTGIFNNRTKYIDGFKIEIQSITLTQNDLIGDKLTISLEVTNTSTDKNTAFISFKTYVDDYEQSSDGVIISDLLSGKKTNNEITMYLSNKDWKKIELYYTTDYETYEPFYTITPNDIDETH